MLFRSSKCEVIFPKALFVELIDDLNHNRPITLCTAFCVEENGKARTLPVTIVIVKEATGLKVTFLGLEETTKGKTIPLKTFSVDERELRSEKGVEWLTKLSKLTEAQGQVSVDTVRHAVLSEFVQLFPSAAADESSFFETPNFTVKDEDLTKLMIGSLTLDKSSEPYLDLLDSIKGKAPDIPVLPFNNNFKNRVLPEIQPIKDLGR